MNKLLYAALATALAAPAAAKPAYILIDAQGTHNSYGLAVNADGAVAGEYGDDNRAGFIRYPDGSVVTFAVEGAARTSPLGLNDSGQAAGIAYSTAMGQHGFLRQPDGTLTLFDYPGADATAAFAINAGGAVAGAYFRKGEHGFVRDAGGAFHSFDVPGTRHGVEPHDINAAGTVTGFYSKGRTTRGFIRDAEGTITTFDAPGAQESTLPVAIAADGTVAGYCFDADDKSHGFVRKPDGTFEVFAVEGARMTFVTDINDAGAVTGNSVDADGQGHGFLRKPDGSVRTIDVRPRRAVTHAAAISNSGAIAGSFTKLQGKRHSNLGFLRLP